MFTYFFVPKIIIIKCLFSTYRNIILTMLNTSQSTCSTASTTGIHHYTISILHHTEHSEPVMCVGHHPLTLSPTNICHIMYFITFCKAEHASVWTFLNSDVMVICIPLFVWPNNSNYAMIWVRNELLTLKFKPLQWYGDSKMGISPPFPGQIPWPGHHLVGGNEYHLSFH